MRTTSPNEDDPEDDFGDDDGDNFGDCDGDDGCVPMWESCRIVKV